ncbi:flagellin N-terminal helical domain-containing protein [Erwinia sp. CGal63]|uniref:flagellin N-terminal helical domain-containing protein n=1 Tax=Erwinia sp. CGal63 TaxID=2919889 RepID=UPI00300A15E3
MLTINNNETALATGNARTANSSLLAQSIERLSSGLRINGAHDDAAGQAIANRMQANVNADSAVTRGLNDAISYAQTAESALGNISDMLIKAKSLAVRAANGTMSASDRQSYNDEYQQLLAGINGIANGTEIFGQFPLATDTPELPPVLLGDVAPIGTKFPVQGQNYSFSSGVISLAYIPAGTTNISITIDSLSMDDDLQLFTRDGKHLAGTPVDGATDFTWASKNITDDASATSKLMSVSNGFTSGASYDASDLNEGGSSWALNGSETTSYNGMSITYSGDGDRYEDASTGAANDGTVTSNPLERISIDNVTEDLIVVVVGNGSFNSNLTWGSLPQPTTTPAVPPKQSQPLEVITSANYGQPVQSDTLGPTPSDTKTLGLNNTSLLTDGAIRTSMTALDAALNKVNGYRSDYGSKINRYESNKSVLSQQSIATQAAQSRIQDADYAQEASQLAKAQIKDQGQNAVMKMANQSAQNVLTLLRD